MRSYILVVLYTFSTIINIKYYSLVYENGLSFIEWSLVNLSLNGQPHWKDFRDNDLVIGSLFVEWKMTVWSFFLHG